MAGNQIIVVGGQEWRVAADVCEFGLRRGGTIFCGRWIAPCLGGHAAGLLPTGRSWFLRTMDRVVPWGPVIPWEGLIKLIAPFYPKSEDPRRPAKPLLRVLSPSIASEYGVT